MSIDEVPSQTPQHDYDFSNLQGLQIVGAHLGGEEDPSSKSWRDALKLELEARAARFHHAVDASILLSDDGIIRWLGDPIARLAVGPDLLTPRALLLADASLSEAARGTVAARLELWLTATTQRLLGPLLALQSLQDESEPVCELAAKIAEALGVLEREPFRSEIKALDQNSRAALRRHGVRFGAFYVYVPQSLKPASRALALQLWCLRMPDVGGEENAKTLLPLASSGRTSLPVNPLISRDGYRVAGFRPCGERVVRVDIVERLSDMIRAAFVTFLSSEALRPAGSAFLVSGQMTSLTGCSAETFASILRSLGYESFEIERSRLGSQQAASEAGAASATSTDTKTVVAETLETGAEHSIGGKAPDVVGYPDHGDGRAEPLPTVFANQDEAEQGNGALDSSHGTNEPAPGAPEAINTSADSVSVIEATVVAWRPARKPRPERAKRRLPRGEAPFKDSLRRRESGDAEVRVDSLNRPEKGEGRPAAASLDAQKKGTASPRNSERFEGVGEKRRKATAKQNAQGAVAQFEPRRPAAVDPNSPFAKLLELRTVLEKQGKNC